MICMFPETSAGGGHMLTLEHLLQVNLYVIWNHAPDFQSTESMSSISMLSLSVWLFEKQNSNIHSHNKKNNNESPINSIICVFKTSHLTISILTAEQQKPPEKPRKMESSA